MINPPKCEANVQLFQVKVTNGGFHFTTTKYRKIRGKLLGRHKTGVVKV